MGDTATGSPVAEQKDSRAYTTLYAPYIHLILSLYSYAYSLPASQPPPYEKGHSTMAIVDINELFETLRGKIGRLVFRRLPDGRLVVSGAPLRRKKKGTPGQKAYRRTFKERTQFAKWAAKEYPVYARLAAERPMISAYNMALADSSHPPVIHRILRRDGRILVQASDDVLVAKVNVSVSDERGKLLEWLDAVRLEGDWWECIPQLEGRIAAHAWDIPGNQTRMELE